MYEFLDRLINISLPRVRDFRGVSGRSFDGRGNYNMGVKEQIIFPEIDFDQVDAMRGMDIAITTTAQDRRRSQGAARSVPLPVPQLITQETDSHGKDLNGQPRNQAHEARRRSTPRSATR